MRDPYEVLGVDRKASAGDIKSAFRKLAKKLHPDANKNDPKAARRFAEINAAYEILGEDDKRKAFDRGEIDAEGKPRFQGFGGGAGARPGGGFGTGGAYGPEGEFETFTFGPEGFTRGTRRGRAGAGGGGFGGFEDILRDAFAGAARAGAEAVRASKPRISAAGRRQCHRRLDRVAARRGARRHPARAAAHGKDVEVKIPAGIANGQQIRLRGQGIAGPNGHRRSSDHRVDRPASRSSRSMAPISGSICR